jgi:hypothetical protein
MRKIARFLRALKKKWYCELLGEADRHLNLAEPRGTSTSTNSVHQTPALLDLDPIFGTKKSSRFSMPYLERLSVSRRFIAPATVRVPSGAQPGTVLRNHLRNALAEHSLDQMATLVACTN